jgi:glycopeptide antibiotics resistance protein
MQLSTLLSLAITFASAGIVLVLILLAIYLLCYRFIYQKKLGGQKKLPVRRILWWCVFLCYCFVVLSATIFMRFPDEASSRVYSLFYSYREAWITGSASSWRNIILNFFMFLPFGFLLPLGWEKMQQGWRIFLAGFGFSLMIECLQLVTRRGMFEPDDLLGNTVGALIGYGCFLLLDDFIRGIRKKAQKKPRHGLKKVLVAQLPLLATVLTFLIIFIKYQNMELGVHPDQPLDRPNKKTLKVSTSLSFSSESDMVLQDYLYANSRSVTMPTQDIASATDLIYDSTSSQASSDKKECMVWKSKQYSLEQATEKVSNFFSMLDTTLQPKNIRSYDREAFFYSENHKYTLVFSYNGGAYYLTDDQLLFPEGAAAPEPVTGACMEELLSALQKYDISFSEAALKDTVTFTERRNGWYRFDFKPAETEAGLLFGFLECCYYGDAGIGVLNYHLQEGTPYKTFPILSAVEAYGKIKAGNFQYYDDTSSTASPLNISVTDCALTYVTDTKGFLQPTYEFSCIINDKKTTIRIPALK